MQLYATVICIATLFFPKFCPKFAMLICNVFTQDQKRPYPTLIENFIKFS